MFRFYSIPTEKKGDRGDIPNPPFYGVHMLWRG